MIGAGFSILPGAGRLWVPERAIIVPDHKVSSIWKTHYISYPQTNPDVPGSIFYPVGPTPHPGFDKIYCKGNRMWIQSAWGELPLKEMRRPLSWEPKPDSLTFYSEVTNHRWNENV